MKSKISAEEVIAKMLKLNRPQEDMSTNELIALLCQIALALLIIFVMANVLFMARARAEVDIAKGMIGDLQKKIDILNNTDVGKEHSLREKALMELQQQRLYIAIGKINSLERIRYGLSTFTATENKETVYRMDDLFNGTTVVNERFKSACVNAEKTMSDRKAMVRDWYVRAFVLSGLGKFSGGKEITETPSQLTSSNEEWLLGEIDKYIDKIETNCREMQKHAMAMMQKHYQDNINALVGTKVYKIVGKCISAPPEMRGILIREFQDELYEHSKSVFEKQKVPLLDGV